jgi:mRNA interferase RelE/StbE
MTGETCHMRITYHKQAIKVLERLDVPTKQRIKKGIEAMPLGDIVRLQGHTELYRLRVGDWRIVFTYPEPDVTLIERISPRGDVYKGV